MRVGPFAFLGRTPTSLKLRNISLTTYVISRILATGLELLRHQPSDFIDREDSNYAPRKTAHPTDAELEILRVLWERGPCSVREVYESIAPMRDVGYTTVLKLLQIMFEKGHVTRDESRRSHVYQAKLKRTETQRQLIGVLLDKAFDGATGQLVLQAINSKKLSHKEIADVRKLLDDIEK